MLKIITNKTDGISINCDIHVHYLSGNHDEEHSRLLLNNTVGIFFIKINNISKKDLKECRVLLFYETTTPYTGNMRIYGFNNSYSGSTSTQYLAGQFVNGDVSLIDKISIPTFTTQNMHGVQIDVTDELLKCQSDESPYAWVALRVNFTSANAIMLYPYTHYIVSTLEYVSATLCDNGQILAHNSLKEYNCGSFDKGYLNLYTGKNYHIYNCYQSNASKIPLSLSLCYNQHRKTKRTLVGDNLYHNYQYDIYEENGGIIIEDYVGNRRFYSPVDKNDASFNFYKYGIKHLETTGDLYYCYEDASYFYMHTTNNDIDEIYLYDQQGNYYHFRKYGMSTQIVQIKDIYDHYINFYWSDIVSL